MDSANKRKLRVFLCHASKDKDVVRILYQRLKEDGFEPWLDEESLAPGQNWRFEIEDQVRLSDAFVVCLTKESAKKESFYQKEIKVAFDAADEKPDGAIFIIPVRLEPLEVADLPRRLRDTHWANLYEPLGYDRLVDALRRRAEEIYAEAPAVPAGPNPFQLPVSGEMTDRNRPRGPLGELQRWSAAHLIFVLTVSAALLVVGFLGVYKLYRARVEQQRESIRLEKDALTQWRVLDLANANALFGRAVAADGENGLARAYFALSLKERGNDVEAKSQGDQAAAGSSHLKLPERLWVQGVQSEVNSKWKEAAKNYSQLLPLGDQLEVGLRLAQVQTFGGDPQAANMTLSQLPPSDARVTFARAIAANFLGDFATEIDYLNKIADVNEPLLSATALSQRCWAFYKSDNLKGAEPDCNKAETLFSDNGDQLGMARSLTRLALVLAHQDQTSKIPMDSLNRALSITRYLHAQRDEAGVLENRANLRMDQSPSPSDIEDSRKDYEEASGIYSAIADKRGQASLINDAATCSEDLCQFENAKTRFSNAKKIYEEMGSEDASTATANFGSMLYLLGDLAGARTALVTALRSPHSSDEDRNNWAVTLGDVFKSQGDLARAEQCFQGAACYELLSASGAKPLGNILAIAVPDFVVLRVDEGRAAEVEGVARKEVARTASAKDSEPDERATAMEVLAQVLLSEGGKSKLPEANNLVRRATDLAQDCRTRLSLTIIGGRILAQSDPRTAQDELKGAKEQARKLGLLGQSLEAQFALAEAEVLAKDPAARREVMEFETAAHASGFVLLESKAKALVARISAY